MIAFLTTTDIPCVISAMIWSTCVSSSGGAVVLPTAQFPDLGRFSAGTLGSTPHHAYCCGIFYSGTNLVPTKFSNTITFSFPWLTGNSDIYMEWTWSMPLLPPPGIQGKKSCPLNSLSWEDIEWLIWLSHGVWIYGQNIILDLSVRVFFGWDLHLN